MSPADAGLIAATGYVVGLIGWILWDASRPERNERRTNDMSLLKKLWHRIVPLRHPTPEEIAKAGLLRRLRWRVDSRLERAIRANRLPEDDARAVRREYKRLTATRGSLGALAAAIDYAATLAPKEKGPVSW